MLAVSLQLLKQIGKPYYFLAGEANVLQLFKIDVKRKKIPVAGCRCITGMLHRKKQFKLVRNDETILNGKRCPHTLQLHALDPCIE